MKTEVCLVAILMIASVFGGCISDNYVEKNFVNGQTAIQSENEQRNPSTGLQLTTGLTCKILSPDNNAILSGLIKISGTAKAENTIIQKVYEWNTSWKENGNYTIQARCDGGKVYSEIELLNITIENKLPNKWAILCCAATDSTSLTFGKPSTFIYNSTMEVYNIIQKNLSYPAKHIFLLINESFTKRNLLSTLLYIKNTSYDFPNAQIILYFDAHGGTWVGSDGKLHSAIACYVDGATHDENNVTPEDQIESLYDYELKTILDSVGPSKMFVSIYSCEGGCFANMDVTGKMHGMGDSILWGSCGGPGRIVLAESVTLSTGEFIEKFWREGLANNMGDTNPINGNKDGKTSVEEAYYYWLFKNFDERDGNNPSFDDRYPSANPEDGEMFL